MLRFSRCLLSLAIFALAACSSANLTQTASVSRAHEFAATGIQGPVYIKARSSQSSDKVFEKYAAHISNGLLKNGVVLADKLDEARYVALIDYIVVNDRHKYKTVGEVTAPVGGVTERDNQKYLLLKIYDLQSTNTDKLTSVYEAISSISSRSVNDSRLDKALSEALFTEFYARVQNDDHRSITTHWSENGHNISE